jgi:hypothetical protein
MTHSNPSSTSDSNSAGHDSSPVVCNRLSLRPRLLHPPYSLHFLFQEDEEEKGKQKVENCLLKDRLIQQGRFKLLAVSFLFGLSHGIFG